MPWARRCPSRPAFTSCSRRPGRAATARRTSPPCSACWQRWPACESAAGRTPKREGEPVKDPQYFAPATLEEALKLLGKHGKGISVLAGGTDLGRDMNLEFKIPDNILWIGRLGLEYIRTKEGILHIGAAPRMPTAGASKVFQEEARGAGGRNG